MKSMGFRCFSDGYSYVVLDGTCQSPVIVANDHRTGPANADRPETLQWFRLDVHEILDSHVPTGVLFKTIEPSSRNKNLKRAQLEGILMEAVLSHDLALTAYGRTKVQIKSRVGFEKSARYINDALKTLGLSTVDTSNFREAALAALSGLPNN